MTAMLYKEMLSARPQLWTVLVIGVVLIVSDLLGTDGLSGVSGLLTVGVDGWMLLTGALAFALGHAQIGPEVSRGHVELLDGLPVNRGQVYVAKLVAGLSTLLLLVAVSAIDKVAITQLTWGELAGGTMLTVFGAISVGLFSFYGTGLLLSWFGGFGWAMLGVGLTFLGTFAEVIELLRPLSIFHGYGTVRFEANEPIVVLWPLAAWGIHGTVCILLSGLMFIGRADRLVTAGSGLGAAMKALLVFGVGGLLILLGTITAVRLAGRAGEGAGPPNVVQAGSFQVLVPKEAPAVAQDLIDRIPAIDAAVRGLLGAEAPLRLDVELAGGGRFHAGLYTGGKIRMALDENAAHVFAHELVHAYADVIARRRVRRHHNALRFFNEGLAMWAAEQVVEATEEIDAHRAWAGALYALDQHHVDPLMNDSGRAASNDPFEPYPLGLSFVEGLVAAEGPKSVQCILRQIGLLPDRKLTGVAVWDHLIEACGFDFSAINAAYEARLRGYAARWPLPPEDAVGQPMWSNGRLVLRLPPLPDDVDPLSLEPGQRRRCRFRSRIAAPPADIDEEMEGTNNECLVGAIISATNTVSFQVGVRLEGGWTAYTRWVQQPVPDRPAP